MESFQEKLRGMEACHEAVAWVGDRTLEEAWLECERADWMLWLAAKMLGQSGWPSHQDLVLAACDCAETALKYVPEGEERPRLAIQAARAWAENPCEETRSDAAAHASAAHAAAHASDAAAYAAYSAAAAHAHAAHAHAAAHYASDAAAAAAHAHAAHAHAAAHYASYASDAAASDAAASDAHAADAAASDAAASDAHAADAHAHAAASAARTKSLANMADMVRGRLFPGVM
jgi:hypothetical protein